MAHSRILDTTSPLDSTKEGFFAKRIRQTKEDTDQRMSVDHAFAESIDYDGEHKIITLRQQATPGTSAADKGYLYTEEISSKAELCYKDELGNKVQLTEGGDVVYQPRNIITFSMSYISLPTNILVRLENTTPFINGKLYIPNRGYFCFQMRARFLGLTYPSTGSILLYKNGELIIRIRRVTNYDTQLILESLIFFNANDYLEIYFHSVEEPIAMTNIWGTVWG